MRRVQKKKNKSGNVLYIWEVAAYFMLLENSRLIKTKVKEQRFMEIPPKVQASGHNRLVPDITLGVSYISQILFRMMIRHVRAVTGFKGQVEYYTRGPKCFMPCCCCGVLEIIIQQILVHESIHHILNKIIVQQWVKAVRLIIFDDEMFGNGKAHAPTLKTVDPSVTTPPHGCRRILLHPV